MIKKIMATFAGVAEVFPRILVVGALGRCGKGAIEMLLKMGIPKYASITYTCIVVCVISSSEYYSFILL